MAHQTAQWRYGQKSNRFLMDNLNNKCALTPRVCATRLLTARSTPLSVLHWEKIKPLKNGADFFKIKFLLDTCPFVGPLIPLFWTSGDVSSGFQSQSGFCLIRTFADTYVIYVP